MVFTGQKTQPTVTKYWRRVYKGKHKQRREHNTHKYEKIHAKKIRIYNTASSLVYNNMGRLGDSSQGRFACCMSLIGLNTSLVWWCTGVCILEPSSTMQRVINFIYVWMYVCMYDWAPLYPADHLIPACDADLNRLTVPRYWLRMYGCRVSLSHWPSDVRSSSEAVILCQPAEVTSAQSTVSSLPAQSFRFIAPSCLLQITVIRFSSW